MLLESYLKTAERSPAVVAYLAAIDHLRSVHPSIAEGIVSELKDQRSHLKLIASENYSSLSVQLAMGNLLTDKYAEGVPFHRFYAGCENVDAIEEEAAKLACQLFGCDHAYVQPHSGADANLIAFWAIVVQRVQNRELEKLQEKKIDTLSTEDYETIRRQMTNQKILGMSLASGGHLTHGYRHNISGKMFRSATYDVNFETGKLDYSALKKQAEKERPLILLAGYSAYPRRINFAKMREIADSVGAVLMVDMAHFAGLVAGGVFEGEENPIPYAHIVTSTTHKTLRGPRGGLILCQEEFRETVDKGCPLAIGGPLPHVMAAKAVAFKEALSPSFKDYSKQVVANSRALAGSLIKRGVSVLTGGTDNHLLLFDTRSFGLNGRQAELALRRAKVTVNRNAIPNDPNGPWYTSGVRLGSPAMTTLGMKEAQMDEIAEIITSVLQNTTADEGSRAQSTTEEQILQEASQHVNTLLTNFPLYPEIPVEV